MPLLQIWQLIFGIYQILNMPHNPGRQLAILHTPEGQCSQSKALQWDCEDYQASDTSAFFYHICTLLHQDEGGRG